MEYKINDNILLYKVDQHYEEDLEVTLQTDSQSLILYVNLNKDQENQYKSLLSDYEITTKKDHTIIDIINKDTGISTMKKGTYKQFLQVVLTKEFLEENLPLNKSTEKLIDFFEGNGNIKNISYKQTNTKTQSIAYEIFHNSYNKDLEKLYMESKVLELLYTELDSLLQKMPKKLNSKVKLSKQDKDAIFEAKKILSQNLQNPPSIKSLAKQVAINELKLKVGFNHFFNESPYNVSLEYRLQKAKNLLEASELNIAEISYQTGYKYPQNFSNAFFKRFGVRPIDFIKSRKYYY